MRVRAIGSRYITRPEPFVRAPALPVERGDRSGVHNFSVGLLPTALDASSAVRKAKKISLAGEWFHHPQRVASEKDAIFWRIFIGACSG